MPAPATEPHQAPRRLLRVNVPDALYQRISAAARRRNITRTGLVKVILSATFPDESEAR
jgi:hypothetical protein